MKTECQVFRDEVIVADDGDHFINCIFRNCSITNGNWTIEGSLIVGGIAILPGGTGSPIICRCLAMSKPTEGEPAPYPPYQD
jgi:hypothetical protein